MHLKQEFLAEVLALGFGLGLEADFSGFGLYIKGCGLGFTVRALSLPRLFL